MPEHSDLMHKADELRQQAEHEPDANISKRLRRMADRYVHLAQSQAWSKEHPPSPAALAAILTSRH